MIGERWELLKTLPDAVEADPRLGSATILCWNPCDGLHSVWLAARGSAERFVAENRDFFTHWCRAPRGPHGQRP